MSPCFRHGKSSLVIFRLEARFIQNAFIKYLVLLSKKMCLLFVCRYPFNSKKFPIGYSLASCFELAFLCCCTINSGCYIKFLNGSRMMVVAFVENIRLDLKSLNESLKENQRTSKKTRAKLNGIIKFHSETIQLSQNLIISIVC